MGMRGPDDFGDGDSGGGVVAGAEADYTHHYSVQPDGSIHYTYTPQKVIKRLSSATSSAAARSTPRNGIDLGDEFGMLGDPAVMAMELEDDDESPPNPNLNQSFEFEDVATMPLAEDLERAEEVRQKAELQTQIAAAATARNSNLQSQIQNQNRQQQQNQNLNQINQRPLIFRNLTSTPSSPAPSHNFRPVSPMSRGINPGAISPKIKIENSLIIRPKTKRKATPTTTMPQLRMELTPHGSSSSNLKSPLSPLKSSSNSTISKTAFKRPKLLLNLYDESLGYEFGADDASMSPLLPYAEDSLLRAIDAGTLPSYALADLENQLVYRRGHLPAEIRDFRNRSRKSKNKAPVINHVVLRPCSASLSANFDEMLATGYAAREKWKRNRRWKEVDEENEDEDTVFEVKRGKGGLSWEERLELEKEFVNATAEPLCLDPGAGELLRALQFERLKWKTPKLEKKLIKWERDSWRRREEAAQDALPVDENERPGSVRSIASRFLKFISSVRTRQRILSHGKSLNPDPIQGTHAVLEYPVMDPPEDMRDIQMLAPNPPLAGLRTPEPADNVPRKIEMYTLETERRKRPHKTKLCIIQRDTLDSYYGELEMESMAEGSSYVPRPGSGLFHPKDNSAPPTRCKFELGSSRSVALYVQQFSDIFTEDGKRPCKISYQKLGIPGPQILYKNDYPNPDAIAVSTSSSSASATSSSSSTSTSSSLGSSTNQSQNQSPVAVPMAQIQRSPAPAPQTPTTPPVQIVHPQPRSAPQPTPTPQHQPQLVASQMTSNVNVGEGPVGMGHSVNFNVNVNSGQQILTRPQLISINQAQAQAHAQAQAQSSLAPPSPSPKLPTPTTASQAAAIQQRLMRLKAQQAQAQAQPTLAKLLLSSPANATSSNSNFPPGSNINRIVAVQPQPQLQAHAPTQSQNINQHQGAHAQTQNVNLNLGHNVQGALNVNLNTMLLEPPRNVNILRGGGAQNLNSAHAQQGRSFTHASLQSLLSQGQSQGQGQGRIIIGGQGDDGHGHGHGHVVTSQHQLIDSAHAQGHNLNLNLNVNLNAQENSAAPPFLVFISPLRSLPLNINQGQAQGRKSSDDNAGGGEYFDNGEKKSNEELSGLMIGNTAYSVSVSNASTNTGSDSITLSDLLGSSSAPGAGLGVGVGGNYILQQPGGILVSSSGGNSNISSSVSSTPRLSALLAGTPSADSHGHSGHGHNVNLMRGNVNDASRTLLDRLAASLSSSSGSSTSSSGPASGQGPPILTRYGHGHGSGLNPIATATPNVVLDHPVLAATLTGGAGSAAGPSTSSAPKLVSAYRQIAPAPSTASAAATASPGGRGKQC